MIGRTKDPERPPRVGRGLYKRVLLGCVLIILATGAVASASVLLTLQHVVDILRHNEGGQSIQISSHTLTKAKAGHAQTLLVLGSDRRFHDPKAVNSFAKPQQARSDTIMLIHMDPNAGATTVLSIPRDLQVQIPGFGTDKINAAYSDGGPDLVAKTVKQLLGPQLKINHVINVQFGGFQRAVNYLHGVYVDVDQFYYHTNAHLPPSAQYSAIDVKPGYQKLTGSKALAYVRYRHTDSDFIRADRQQDFLREVKDQVGESKLVNELFPLIDVVSHYVQFDKDFTTKHGILDLLYLAAYSTRNPVQQITFPNGADINTATADYVTVDHAALPSTMRKFLHPVAGVKAVNTKTPPATKHHHHHTSSASTALAPGLVSGSAMMENAMAPIIARRQVSFPVYIPHAIVSGTHLVTYDGSPKLENPYPYSIYDRNVDKKHPKGHPHSAYRIVMSDNLAQGGYYGIQGTDWMNPPLIGKPTETVKRNGRKLMFFTSGGKLRFVAWKTPHAVYWVSNTLDYELSNKQMVGIALSLTRYPS